MTDPQPTLRALLARRDLDLRLASDEAALPADALDAPLRWVHSSDLADPTPFLADDLLLLTTGTQFASLSGIDGDSVEYSAYVARLRTRGVRGLGFGTEVVRDGIPPALAEACRDQGMPLFEVPYRTPFIALARANAEAIAAQARELAYYHAYAGHGSEAAITLAQMVMDRAPQGMARVYFGLSGSDANETNIKLVWYYNNVRGLPKKKKIISRQKAYRGVTIVAASMTGGQEPHVAVPWFWSDQYDQMLQTAGLPTTAVTEVVRERADGSLIHFGLDAGGRLVAATSLGRGPVVAKDIRVAEQLIATHATPDPAALADPGVALRSLR